jgi:Fe-S oxidoreductase
MLRAKTYKFQHNGTKWRDRLIASTDPLFDAASLPGVAQAANAAANVKVLRKLGDKAVGIHAEAPLPRFHSKTLSKRIAGRTARDRGAVPPRPSETTRGKVALFVTCYGDHIEPEVVEDLIAVLEHNGIPVTVLTDTQCCGMPKLELGDLDAVAAQKDKNLPAFLRAVDQGLDLMSIIPSCTLMYRQEVPLMFPDEDDVARVADAFFDPFEYLWLRSKDDLINTAFVNPLGKVAYHAACHQRVQNFGPRTRDVLSMIPGTDVTLIDRCSGHDGTYAVKSETYAHAMKIARPVVNRVKQAEAQIYGSDCPMAGRMIAHGMNDGSTATHPISMLRKAYGI